jgi:hypothetical protein
MKRYWLSRYLLSGLTILSFMAITVPLSLRAQTADALRDFVHVGDNYQFISNIVYRTASNWDAKLDVYEPRGLKAPNPPMEPRKPPLFRCFRICRWAGPW